MKLGFLGGTFDPIHFGHLNLGLAILEKKRLDGLFFCPANCSPGKRGRQPAASISHRLEMVALAIKPITAFSLFDWEAKRPGPSYTIDALRQLQTKHPGAEFHLILGEDLLAELPSWKEIEHLLQLAPPLIGTRHQRLPASVMLPPSLTEPVRAGLTRIPLLDISSTQLRERLQTGLYCGHLLPAKVLDYIAEHRLYS